MYLMKEHVYDHNDITLKATHLDRTCLTDSVSCGLKHFSWFDSGEDCTASLPHQPAPGAGTCEHVKGEQAAAG